jgi:hypothetical protein
MFLTSKLITCFIDCFLYIYIYIGFWTLKMKCTQYGLYGQAAFKNARAILFFEIVRSR